MKKHLAAMMAVCSFMPHEHTQTERVRHWTIPVCG